MKFILCDDWDKAILDLGARLQSELQKGRKVLWLTSGGSNIQATVRIMQAIPGELSRNLTIMPNDERYGPDGHHDSNWQQLIDEGIDFKSARAIPVLRGQGFDETRRSWEQDVAQTLKENDVILLHLGMGPDGHVSGILPGSPAVEASGLVCAYESDPYQRLTMTFEALKSADVTYLFAFGEAKKPQLETLRDKEVTLAEQPGQVLKQMNEVYVYNDQIGETA